MSVYHWTCPFCNRDTTLVDTNTSTDTHHFNNNNKDGSLGLVTSVLVCPNPKCKEYTIDAALYKYKYDTFGNRTRGEKLLDWKLRPLSSAKPFPDYIPSVIINDYQEACLIKDLSPKASATLSRRCLQGMIRDFWGIKKDKLIHEIEELEKHVDTLTWGAIDNLRKIGNIGAHMEKDIDVIIDIDPDEANLLIGLIENLLKDWYIQKHDKEERYKKIIDLKK